MNKNLGIQIGSFNPIHNGHLMVTNYVLENTDVEEIIIVPSPHSFGKSGLVSFYLRCDMIDEALREYELEGRVDWNTIENVEGHSGYTSDTLKYFKDEYDGGGNKVSLIIGADLFIDLHKFHDIEWILANCEVIVCGRPNNKVAEGYVNLAGKYKTFSALRINVLENFPQIGISSSFIRDQIKEGKDIWSYVPKSVCKLIDKHALYKRE